MFCDNKPCPHIPGVFSAYLIVNLQQTKDSLLINDLFHVKIKAVFFLKLHLSKAIWIVISGKQICAFHVKLPCHCFCFLNQMQISNFKQLCSTIISHIMSLTWVLVLMKICKSSFIFLRWEIISSTLHHQIAVSNQVKDTVSSHTKRKKSPEFDV